MTKVKNYKTLVTITTKNQNQYSVPSDYSDLNISQIIRKMTSDGYTKYQIHKITQIRYQHVRNVLLNPVKK